MSNQNLTKIKVVLLGDGGVGKTSLVHRLRTGEFIRKYIPTMGVEVHPLQFNTNNGRVVLNCWDTAGQEKYGGLMEGYYVGATHFIIFFDLQSRTSFKNVKEWMKSVYGENRDAHVTLVGMKCDIGSSTECEVSPEMFGKFPNIKGYMCSAKSNYNFEKPFLNVIRNVMGEDTHFIETNTVQQPEVTGEGIPEREESESESKSEPVLKHGRKT